MQQDFHNAVFLAGFSFSLSFSLMLLAIAVI